MDRHRLSLIVVGVLAIGILLGTFFLGVQPQLDRVARADEQRVTVAQTNATQQARNAALAQDQAKLEAYRAQLATAQAEIPAQRAQQALIDQLHGAAASAGVTITALTFDTEIAWAAPSGTTVDLPPSGTLVAIPMTLAATGERAALEQFAANVQAATRIVTVLSSQYSGPDEPTLTLQGTTWALKPAE